MAADAGRATTVAGPAPRRNEWAGQLAGHGRFVLAAARHQPGRLRRRLPGLPARRAAASRRPALAVGLLLWQPGRRVEQTFANRSQRAPSVVGFRRLVVFRRRPGGRLAARLRDRAWAAKQPFSGLAYFDHDPQWVIEADWETLSPPLSMEVPNVSGDLKRVEVAHRAVFSVGGEQVSLLPMAVSDTEVFFVFRDRTSGRETYGAGRFPQGACPGRQRSGSTSIGPITRPAPSRPLPPARCRHPRTGCHSR